MLQPLKRKYLWISDFDYFELESSHRGNNYDAFAEIDFSQYDDREGLKLVRPVAKRPMQFFTEIKEGDWLVFNNLLFDKEPEEIIMDLKAETQGGIIEIRKGSLTGDLVASCLVATVPESTEWNTQSYKIKSLKNKEKLYFIFRGNNEGLSIKSFSFR